MKNPKAINYMTIDWCAVTPLQTNNVDSAFCWRKVLWALNIQTFERRFLGHWLSFSKPVPPWELHGDLRKKRIVTNPNERYLMVLVIKWLLEIKLIWWLFIFSVYIGHNGQYTHNHSGKNIPIRLNFVLKRYLVKRRSKTWRPTVAILTMHKSF